MSDVVATYGLDYGDYKKGLADIERHSAKHFASQEKASLRAAQTIGTAAKAFIGDSVFRASMRLATGAIEEFAERSPEAARALEDISRKGKDAAAAIGQDLYYALGIGTGGMGKMIDKGVELWSTLVDLQAQQYRGLGIGAALGGDGTIEEINAARAAALDSEQFGTFQKNDAIRRLEDQAAIREAGGGDASDLREQARSRRAMREIGAIKYAPERDARRKREEDLHTANLARIKREADERAAMDERRMSAERKTEAERAANEDRRAAADIRRMAMERELASLEWKALRVDELRAQGRDQEAEDEATLLEYAKNAARIRGDGSIGEQDRRERLDVNRQQYERSLDISRQRREREAADDARLQSEREAEEASRIAMDEISDVGILGRVSGAASIESGLGGRSGLRAQVFGAGGGGLEPMTKEQKRANALLERIERNTARSGAAVFA